MKINIGITEKKTQKIAEVLNVILADETVLYTKTRHFHWNYEGGSFMEMHKLYESHYEELAEQIDEVAERIRMIGHYAVGNMKEYLKITRLKEAETIDPDFKKQIKDLLTDHETLINELRIAIPQVDDELGDVGTADFLTGLMRFHEQKAWMLRAYLK